MLLEKILWEDSKDFTSRVEFLFLCQIIQVKITDIGLTDVGSSEDVERPERIVGFGHEGSWMDPSMKLHVSVTVFHLIF